MIWGVTGHRTVSERAAEIVCDWGLSLSGGDVLYHGCCIGVDETVAIAARAALCTVVAVIPASVGLISAKALEASHHRIYAPPGRGSTNDYRARNELLIYQLAKQVGRLKGFWNGSYRSGTSMTINIARRANVPVEIQEISNA